MRLTCAAAIALCCATALPAHDVWVQTNTNIIRKGDAVYADMMLGNHGNDHRDFKLAAKMRVSTGRFTWTSPDGKVRDLAPGSIDMGYTPKEGFWSAKVVSDQEGLHLVAFQSSAVVPYAPKRAVKSAKTWFVVSPKLDAVPVAAGPFAKPLGHALELVPMTNPVTPMGPGVEFKVKLLFNGKPLANEKISFIPRGVELDKGFDKKYERMTDADGTATFTPTDGNYYLVVAHKKTDEKGTGTNGKPYEFTQYGATLTLFVPQTCACCG